MNENKVNSSRTVQVGCRVRPEVSEWLKTSGNVSDFLNEIIEDRYENKVIVVNENMVILSINDSVFMDMKTLLNENPEYENIENIAKMAISKYVSNVFTYGLDENDERLLTPEREAYVKVQFQTLLDENMKSIKDENIQLVNENRKLQDEINVFINRENVENISENIENNPVFINLQNENKRLQDEINGFMNRENIENTSENIENNPVFMKLKDENMALKSENARLKTEDLETVLAEIARFKLANQAGLDNMVNKAHDFMKKYSVKTVSTEKLKSYYIEAFENYEANTGNSDPR